MAEHAMAREEYDHIMTCDMTCHVHGQSQIRSVSICSVFFYRIKNGPRQLLETAEGPKRQELLQEGRVSWFQGCIGYIFSLGFRV